MKFFTRSNFSNQRLFFDNHSDLLFTGDDSSLFLIFDIKTQENILTYQHEDVINGVECMGPDKVMICSGTSEPILKNENESVSKIGMDSDDEFEQFLDEQLESGENLLLKTSETCLVGKYPKRSIFDFQRPKIFEFQWNEATSNMMVKQLFTNSS